MSAGEAGRPRTPLHRHTVRDRLSQLSGFFRRLDEWDAVDRPPPPTGLRQLLPIAEEPLPRFLDDAAAAKLPAAARQGLDPFARPAIEILARIESAVRKGAERAVTRAIGPDRRPDRRRRVLRRLGEGRALYDAPRQLPADAEGSARIPPPADPGT
ncbi:hypothetical protein ACIBAG_26215 [Streptomyces sp. NPDC051243]|uniref:hypothetical protein n=1 Tax=Streptomyces sp. NPDC051243 TaxID=3365646 RepID=UPI003794D5FC